MREGGLRRSSLAWGLRCLGQSRLIALLAVTTVLLALPPALALWPAFHAVFARTLAGDHVLRSHPTFAPADVLEFLHEKFDSVAGAWRAALGAAIAGIFLQVLYAGGFVQTLARDGRVRLSDFFTGAFQNFWHNLKCFAIFVPAAGIVLGLWLGSTGAAARGLFEESPPGATAPLLFRSGAVVAALLLFAILSLLQDFARIARRHDPHIGAWRAYAWALRVLNGAWFAALGLFAFWLLVGGGVWLSLLALEWGTAAFSLGAIALHTLLQLAALCVRCAVRVGAWGSFIALAQGRVLDREARRAVSERPTSPLPASEPPPLDLIGETPLT